MLTKHTFTVALVAALANVATVLADVAINNPIEGTQWQAGKSIDVTWLPGPNGISQGAEVEIELMQGSDEKALKRIDAIGKAKESDLKATVMVPANLPSDSNYAIRIGNNYSHYFTIIGSGSGSNGGSRSNGRSSSSSSSASSSTTTTESSSTSTSTTESTTSTSTSTSTINTPSKTPIRLPSSATAMTLGAQPLVFTGSLIALVPVAILAIWGF